MDFQPQPVAGAVKKSLHASVALAGVVAALREKLQDALMNFRRRGSGADFLQRDFLPVKDGVVKFFHGLARAPAHDGARDVAEIAGLLRARENIEDDRLMRAQRPVAAFVRVAALFAAGDDGVGRQPARLQDGAVNHRAQPFGGQRRAAINQLPPFVDFRKPQRLHALGHADLGHHQRGGNFPDFVGRLEFAFREKIGARFQFDAEPLQIPGQPERKIVRHDGPADFVLAQNFADDLGEAGEFHAVAAEFLLIGGQRDGAAVRRLPAGAVNLQVAQDEERAAAEVEIDERVGHEQARWHKACSRRARCPRP